MNIIENGVSVQKTEDETFERLKRTDYLTVWKRCKVHIHIDDTEERCRLIRETKESCGWTEDSFRIEWDSRWSDWDRYERR